MGITHKIYSTFKPTSDINESKTYQVIEFSLTCTPTAFLAPVVPIDIPYSVFFNTEEYDFADKWAQDPSCGDQYTETFVFTNEDSSTGVANDVLGYEDNTVIRRSSDHTAPESGTGKIYVSSPSLVYTFDAVDTTVLGIYKLNV